jgi:hypothetical protein
LCVLLLNNPFLLCHVQAARSFLVAQTAWGDALQVRFACRRTHHRARIRAPCPCPTESRARSLCEACGFALVSPPKQVRRAFVWPLTAFPRVLLAIHTFRAALIFLLITSACWVFAAFRGGRRMRTRARSLAPPVRSYTPLCGRTGRSANPSLWPSCGALCTTRCRPCLWESKVSGSLPESERGFVTWLGSVTRFRLQPIAQWVNYHVTCSSPDAVHSNN